MTRTRVISRAVAIAAGALALFASYPVGAKAAAATAAAATPRPLVGVNLHLFFRAPALAPGGRQLSVAEANRMVDRAARPAQTPFAWPSDGRCSSRRPASSTATISP